MISSATIPHKPDDNHPVRAPTLDSTGERRRKTRGLQADIFLGDRLRATSNEVRVMSICYGDECHLLRPYAAITASATTD